MTTGRSLRCAIYTRKSTDEGLDREFNSLVAQREACAAYIASQFHEGWLAVPTLYDDGGHSGGTMERPALAQLLKDIAAGKIDIVVVYKIDRLTRCLADFAKIVQILDAASASFVSVTQAFNTTTSMGRLTLNVLLSFAQFEREVIAERIRDKIAASKARGMWMGGAVPLGYAAVDRKLVVVPEEAETVREIMRSYLKSSSASELVNDLKARDIVSKRRVGRNGEIRGGAVFTKGALYWLLANRLYVGEIQHKGNIYAGQHDAIVERALFDSVQVRLAERTHPRSINSSQRVVSVLAGRIKDGSGGAMTPCHTSRHGRRYRYYASNRDMHSGRKVERIRADVLEAAVKDNLLSHFMQKEDDYFARHLRDLSVACEPKRLSDFYRSLEMTVHVDDKEVLVEFDDLSNVEGLDSTVRVPERQALAFIVARRGFGHEAREIDDPTISNGNNRDVNLLGLMARSFTARDQLLSMTADEHKKCAPSHVRHLERIARLAYLDPFIIRKIMSGDQPSHITARLLSRLGALPNCWIKQRERLRI